MNEKNKNNYELQITPRLPAGRNYGLRMAGFTLIELLITLALAIVIAAVAAPLYSNFYVGTQLTEETTDVVHAVRSAQQRAIAGKNNAGWGVYFGSSQVTLYQGDSYAARNQSADNTIGGTGDITVSTTFTSDDLNFTEGLGTPSESGTITITNIHGTRTVTVNSLGAVEEQ